MRTRFPKIIFSSLILSFGFASIFAAQESKQLEPTVIRQVRSETVIDRKLETAILSALEPEGDDEVRYLYNKVDLNNDGKPDVLVYAFGPTFCGTGGCTALIFQSVNEGYKLIADISLARNPIIVSQSRTRGWNDLILFVAGGGIQPGYYACLRFDGNTYPENPSVEPASILTTKVKGTAYLAGSATDESGILLWPPSQRQSYMTSFECAKARSEVEKTICGVKELADADVEMASIYKSLLSSLSVSGKNQLRHEQSDWLKNRNASCSKSKDIIDCIRGFYKKRTETLKNQK